jgi:hypothetical protein
MKAKYFLAIMFLMTAGCKKETTTLTTDVQGTWELVSSDGAWFGHHDYAPGNGNTFIFTTDNYTQTIKTTDTTYQYSGTFNIYTGKPCDFANEQTLIKFSNSGDVSSFSLSNGELIIGTTTCISDGASSTYRKIQ